MKTVATIEARMSSTRLPGKVLMDIGGVRSLECQVRRLQRCEQIDDIVIATTIHDADEAIVNFAEELGVNVFCGSEHDVMLRILAAAKSVNAELQVQTTGDCPIIDPCIVDEVVSVFKQAEGRYDFVSNEIERSYPIGLDCRVFPVAVLEEAAELCQDEMHRVHGSTYIYRGAGRDRYRVKNVLAPEVLNRSTLRWTLDEQADLDFLKKVMQHFGNRYDRFTALELMQWLDSHPELNSINAGVRQKALEDG